MTKAYLLKTIDIRIEELNQKYRMYFKEDGPSKSKSGRACLRSQTLKDLDTLKLFKYIIKKCPDSFEISDPNMCIIMDRFIEPRRLK